jgi:hypothetical protein
MLKKNIDCWYDDGRNPVELKIEKAVFAVNEISFAGSAACARSFVIFIRPKYKIATTLKQPQVSYHA